MWLRRNRRAKASIPTLRDEYARLLQDTLTDVRPLQDVVPAKSRRRPKGFERVRRIAAEPRGISIEVRNEF